MLLLSATVHSQPAEWGTFQTMHVRKKMSAKDCNEMMKVFKQDDGGECVQLNYIIISKPEDVENICPKNGKDLAGIFTSKTVFKTIECTLKNKFAKHSKCLYTGKSVRGKIETVCVVGSCFT
uniref:Ribonuclease A-domain domain-containing protein n=1 Tax=Labrus bergylta TaxID=56723 RepID=A0A3Q3NKM0_9LABR